MRVKPCGLQGGILPEIFAEYFAANVNVNGKIPMKIITRSMKVNINVPIAVPVKLFVVIEKNHFVKSVVKNANIYLKEGLLL